ncbi:MAG TPA: hypothetical protein EYP08_05605, partial [Pyrodictiaceae archaeon]|nr:hypothetical protein [Pyrodictiaceae archaeon]
MPLSRDELEYAVQVLGRKLSVEELAVLEAEWSEHCSYKSSRRFLKLLPSNASYVVIGPGRDAAAIRLFDDVDLVLVFRIESHNHPSAVDPYNGAATGVGGIVRDVLSLGAKCLFATHFHHLNELESRLPRVRNYRAAVKEEGDEVIFLYRIVPGGTDRSYGIQVARLAGLPPQVVERAREVLMQFEAHDQNIASV